VEDRVEKSELVELLPHFTELALRKVSAYLLMVGIMMMMMMFLL
jgi:hypothetical protein